MTTWWCGWSVRDRIRTARPYRRSMSRQLSGERLLRSHSSVYPCEFQDLFGADGCRTERTVRQPYSDNQRAVVVSVDFFVDVESPIGDTVVPLEVDPNVLVVTPCAVELFWLLVSTETDGATT